MKKQKWLKKARVGKYLVKENGNFPNNDKLPVLVYRGALDLPGWAFHASLVVRNIFSENEWTNSWKDGIYDFHHYHSDTHEALGIYKGEAEVQLGGPGGIIVNLEKGDVIVIPAGVSHKCIREKDLRCVGAYPGGAEHDIYYGRASEKVRTLKKIKKVPLPDKDPLYGSKGPLKEHWMPQITRLLAQRKRTKTGS